MLKFVPDHSKTKWICKHAVQKLPFLKQVTKLIKMAKKLQKTYLKYYNL